MTAATINQAHYQFQDDGADNNTSTLLGSEDTANTGLSLDVVYFLRIKITNTGGMDVNNFQATLQANVNGGTFFNVTTSSTNVRAVAGQDDDGDPCSTERLTNDGGTFQATGDYVEDGVGANVTFLQAEEYEWCYSITFRGADLTAGSENIDFKMVNGAGDLDNYLVTPEATMPAVGDTTALPGVGSLTAAGQVPSLGTGVNVAAGSLSLTGFIPTVTVTDNITIAVPVGSLTLTGFIPVADIEIFRSPAVGTLILTGLIPTLVQTENHIRAPPLGSLTLSGSIPTLNITQTIPIPLGSGVFDGKIPTLLQTFSVDPGVGSGVFTGFVPTVVQTFSVEPAAGNISVTGFIPTLNITQTIAVGAGSGIFSGFVPTLLQTFSIDVGAGSLSVSGFAPLLIQEFSVEPGAGSLSLTGEIPTVVVSAADIVVTPGVGSLSITGFAPTVTINLFAPETGTLSLTGFIPVVITTSAVRGGRVRRKIRYVVEVDGEAFEVSTIAQAQSILLEVRGLAQQAAQKDVKTVTPKLPRITVQTLDRATPKTLQQAVTRTQKTITEAYVRRSREIAQDIEISQLIIAKIEEEERDDESAIIALLLM